MRVDEHVSESIVLLRPCRDPDGFEPIELRAQDGDVRVEAELVEVLPR